MANWYSNLVALLKGSRRQNDVPCGNMDLTNFYSSISQGLDRLEHSLVKEEGFLTLGWYGEAMNLLKTMQSELLALVEKLDLPISPQGQEWLDQYMDETAFMLDLCNLLKSSVSFLHRYRMLVDLLTFENKSSGSLACSKLAIKRFESEKSKFLEGLEGWKDGKKDTNNIVPRCTIEQKMQRPLKNEPTTDETMKNHKRRGSTTNSKSPKLASFAGAMLVVENIALVKSSFLLSVLVFPLASFDMNHVSKGLESLASLGPSFVRLQQGLLVKGRKRSIPGLAEYNMVENAISQVKFEVVDEESKDEGKLSKSIELLKQSSLTLKEGLDMFDFAVNDVFIEVIKGRNMLLRTYSENM